MPAVRQKFHLPPCPNFRDQLSAPSHSRCVQQVRREAAFNRDELIAFHGATCAMPSLLNELAKPGCVRLANQWDHCGVYYVEPIGGLQKTKRE